MACDIKPGSTGANVIQLQLFLRVTKDYMGKIDGQYGPITKAAVTTYQRRHKLVTDGWAGPITTGYMKLECAINNAPTNSDSGWVKVPLFKQHYQDTDYTCGPSSAQMALSELGINASESQLAELMQTSTAGTGHNGFFSGIKKLADKIKVALSSWDVNFNKTGWDPLPGWLADPNLAVILNVNCGPLKYDAYGNLIWISYTGGHYIYPIAIHMSQRLIKVADPRKGIVIWTFSQMEKAMAANANPSYLFIKKD